LFGSAWFATIRKETQAMKLRTLLLTAALAIFTLSVASAKSYDIMLSSQTKVGTVQLKAGEYRLTINGTKATFTDVSTTKAYTTEVKVENTDTKYADTTVDSQKDGTTSVIKAIELGGSKTKLSF
jgi:hypothetical protein